METVPAFSRLLAPDLRPEEFAATLTFLHAFHARAEPAIAAELQSIPSAASMLDGARPRALLTDIVWFGAREMWPPDLPPVRGTAAALGALYVIEGAALGGRVIARHLTRSLGIAVGAGGDFYCRSDADTARLRWNRFTELLESAALDDGTPSHRLAADGRLIAGALDMFSALECWMRLI